MDEGSRQRMKANLHIFLLLARDQPSDFATVVCRDGTVLPCIRLGYRGFAKEQQKRGQPGLGVDACGGRKELTKSGLRAGSAEATSPRDHETKRWLRAVPHDGKPNAAHGDVVGLMERGPATALLEFPARPARARIVAPDLRRNAANGGVTQRRLRFK